MLARHDQLRAGVLQRLAGVGPPRRHARDGIGIARPVRALQPPRLAVEVVK